MSLRRNFQGLISWTAASQVLAVLFIPIISRLFTPDDYGVLAVYLSVATICAAVVTLRLEWHVPNCRRNSSAGSLAIGAILSALFLTGLLVAVASVGFINFEFLPEELASGSPAFFLVSLAAAVLLLGAEHLAVSFCVRSGNVIHMGRARFVRQAVMGFSAVLAAFMLPGYPGLIVATLIGLVAGTSFMIRQVGFVASLRAAVSRSSKIASVLKAVFRRTMISTAVSINNTLSYEAVPILLLSFFSPETAGLYFMSRRLLSKPVTLVSSSMSSSFWSYAAEAVRGNRHEVYRKYLALTKKFALLCVPFLAAVGFAAMLAPYVLGEKWSAIDIALLAASPMSVGALVFSGLGHLVVLRKQHYQLFADITRLLLMFGSVALAAKLGVRGVVAILMLSVSSLIGHMVFFGVHVLAYRHLDDADRHSRSKVS